MDSKKNILTVIIILLFLGIGIGVVLWQSGQVQEVKTARSYPELSLEDLSQEADVIVKAKLSSPTSRVSEDVNSQESIVLRSFALNPQKKLKGKVLQGESVEVRGGSVTTDQGKKLKHDATGAPDLNSDTEYVLFLRKNTMNEDSYRVIGGSQGVYNVDGEMLLPHAQNTSEVTIGELKKRIANSTKEEKKVVWKGLKLKYPKEQIDKVQRTRNKLSLFVGQDTLTLHMRDTDLSPKEYAQERAKDVVSEKRRNSFQYLIDTTIAGNQGISFANTAETHQETIISWDNNTLLHISWDVSEEQNREIFRRIEGSITHKS